MATGDFCAIPKPSCIIGTRWRRPCRDVGHKKASELLNRPGCENIEIHQLDHDIQKITRIDFFQSENQLFTFLVTLDSFLSLVSPIRNA